jgi:hypothetical protein
MALHAGAVDIPIDADAVDLFLSRVGKTDAKPIFNVIL